MRYVNNSTTIYSINEWICFCKNFKTLLDIPLFANFKTQKLFELWRKYLKRTKRTFYIEKLSARFHRLDTNLLWGLHEIRKILKDMCTVDIFDVKFLIKFLD